MAACFSAMDDIRRLIRTFLANGMLGQELIVSIPHLLLLSLRKPGKASSGTPQGATNRFTTKQLQVESAIITAIPQQRRDSNNIQAIAQKDTKSNN